MSNLAVPWALWLLGLSGQAGHPQKLLYHLQHSKSVRLLAARAEPPVRQPSQLGDYGYRAGLNMQDGGLYKRWILGHKMPLSRKKELGAVLAS